MGILLKCRLDTVDTEWHLYAEVHPYVGTLLWRHWVAPLSWGPSLCGDFTQVVDIGDIEWYLYAEVRPYVGILLKL